MLGRIERERRLIENSGIAGARRLVHDVRARAMFAAVDNPNPSDQALAVIEEDKWAQRFVEWSLMALLFGMRRPALEHGIAQQQWPARSEFPDKIDWLVSVNGLSAAQAEVARQSALAIVNRALEDFAKGVRKQLGGLLVRLSAISKNVVRDRVRGVSAALQTIGIADDPDQEFASANLSANIVLPAYGAGMFKGFDRQGSAIAALRYATMRDERVRITHAEMEGVIRDVHDPVWEVWAPPNGYNCRCALLPIFAWQDYEETLTLPNVQPDPGWDRSWKYLPI